MLEIKRLSQSQINQSSKRGTETNKSTSDRESTQVSRISRKYFTTKLSEALSTYVNFWLVELDYYGLVPFNIIQFHITV